jgi:hypothetical protein
MINLNKLFLENLKFKSPNIVEDKINELEIKLNPRNTFELRVKNVLWLKHNLNTLCSVMEMYSHYMLAEGDVICTGLGFGLRENWLLSNNKVKKILCIENCKELIEYHNKHNPILMRKIKVINKDAEKYIGKCDTLLIDHYEEGSDDFILNKVEKVVKNIKHKKLWFWRIENMLTYIPYLNLRKKFSTLPDLNKGQIKHFMTIYFHGK